MMRTELRLRKFNSKGELLEERTQEARSWLRHLFDILYVHLNYGATLANVNDISSTARTLMTVANVLGNLQVGSHPGGTLAGYTTYDGAPSWNQPDSENLGIVVGISNLAVTPIQDALQAKIAHGEGAGQLLYGGTELYGLSFVDPNGQFTIRRYFTNILGGAITVQEVGIYSIGVITITQAWCFCIARDVVAPGITVNNGEILEVTYTPQITA